MRIAVYCIAKDEAAHIRRWANSALDADVRVVVDTGSKDRTVTIAKSAGCKVHHVTVSPWRFDDARNASLALIPGDVDLCIALDADEVLQPGWRDHLEQLIAARPEVTRPSYRYTWSWNPDGTPGLVYIGDKIHARHGYRWKHPVHEVITATTIDEVYEFCGLEIHHHPDGKGRSYLNLLELSVAEDPLDDRNAHYYARELFLKGFPDKAADEFRRHLALPTALWMPERARSMQLLARCEPHRAEHWLLRACAEDPSQREVWLDLAAFHYRIGRWWESLAAVERCLSITERTGHYLSEAEPWGAAPYDYAAIACHRLGLDARALEYGQRALELDPGDERLAANVAQYQAKVPDSSGDPEALIPHGPGADDGEG